MNELNSFSTFLSRLCGMLAIGADQAADEENASADCPQDKLKGEGVERR